MGHMDKKIFRTKVREQCCMLSRTGRVSARQVEMFLNPYKLQASCSSDPLAATPADASTPVSVCTLDLLERLSQALKTVVASCNKARSEEPPVLYLDSYESYTTAEVNIVMGVVRELRGSCKVAQAVAVCIMDWVIKTKIIYIFKEVGI